MARLAAEFIDFVCEFLSAYSKQNRSKCAQIRFDSISDCTKNINRV